MNRYRFRSDCGSGTSSFTLTSTTTSSAAPFTIGMGFRQGTITTSPVLSGISNYQIVIKRLWNDGSVKHAIISGRAPLTANTPLTVIVSNGTAPTGTNMTSANITAAAPTASVQCGAIGTVNLSSILSSPFRTWISGPEMVECHYRSNVGSDPLLNVWFHVRLFADGRKWIRVIVENGYIDVTSADKSYVPTIIIGGVTVYNNSGSTLVHYGQTRYSVEGWIGGNPNVTPSHNPTDLINTRLVPNYWKRNPSATILNTFTQTYTPMNRGDHTEHMHDSGFQYALGILPTWDALYCTTGDPRMYRSVLANGSSLNSYPFIFRDSTTKLVPKPSDWPTTGLGTYSFIATNGYEWEMNHAPSHAYLAYLITGDYWYYETLLFGNAAIYIALSTTFGPRPDGSRGNGTNKVLTAETRGTGWNLRTLTQFCGICPDGDAVATDYKTLLAANMDFWKTRRDTCVAAGALIGYLWEYDVDAYGTGTVAPWQQHFGIQSVGAGSDLEPLVSMTNYNLVRDHLYLAAVGILGDGTTGFCFTKASTYNAKVSVGGNTQNPENWYHDWLTVYTNSTAVLASLGYTSGCSNNTLDGTSAAVPDLAPFGFWGNFLPCIMLAVDHAATGSTAAYNRLTGASNWSAIENSGFSDTPNWGLTPRTIAPPTVPATVPGWVSALPLWQWFSIPNTALSSVAPSPPSLGHVDAKITAWCGAALRRSGSVYILGAAGGHGDYAGNEVDALVLNTAVPQWTQRRGPTPNAYIIDFPAQFYLQEPDGKYRPSAGHTYYSTHFIDTLDQMVVVACYGINGIGASMPPGFPYQTPTGTTPTRSWVFNYSTNDWEDPDYFASYTGGGDFTAALHCKHPTTGDIYVARNTGNGWNRWNAASNTWTHLAGPFAEQNYCASAIDSTRNRILVIGDYAGTLAPRVYDLNGNSVSATFGGLGPDALKLGNASANGGYYPGLVYDEANDNFLAVYNDTTNFIKIRRINASTWSVDEPTVTGTIPAARTNGVLNAVQYVPELGGIVLANSYTGNVKFMRTAIV